MVDIDDFFKGVTTYDGPWIPRLLACFVCEMWLEVPGPCPVSECSGSSVRDASDAEFACTHCLQRQRRPGKCETIGCAKYDQPLWEFSERTYDPPAEQQLVDSAYAVEARRDNKPS